MATEDIFAALIGEPPTDEEKLMRLAQQLRGQTDVGRIFQATGDRVVAPLGAGISKSAEDLGERVGREAGTNRWRKSQVEMNRQSLLQRAKEHEETLRHNREEAAKDRALKKALADAAYKRALDVAKLKGTKTNNAEMIKLGKQYTAAGIPALSSAFQVVDEALKPYIDEKTGKPKGNIPGIGPVDNILAFGITGPDGRPVKQSIASLRNMVLKARSGAAVTNPEMARVYEEIGVLLGGKDEDVLRGVDMLRQAMDYQKQAIYAGYDPAVVEEYESRIAKPQAGGLDAGTMQRSVASPEQMSLEGMSDEQLEALYEQLSLGAEE